MKGTCLKCGCTHERPCEVAPGETCWWVDEQEDLCSGCAARLMATDYALPTQSVFLQPALEELVLVVRSLRAGLEACRLMFANQQQAIAQAADELAARYAAAAGDDGPRLEPDFSQLEYPPRGRIWTP